MTQQLLWVRESGIDDMEKIVDYFLKSDHDFLTGMGVDVSKLPSKAEWITRLQLNSQLNNERKEFYYISWLSGDKLIGHSNINKIVPSQEAYMHLHLWEADKRQKGMGLKLLKMTLPFYFNSFKLKELFCEPYAKNPAPNRTLEKLGFDFIKYYDTTPGWINLHQTVNRWRLTKEKFDQLS
jgi:[ribosomal protein S5]-alanine N-acetyltransferase